MMPLTPRIDIPVTMYQKQIMEIDVGRIIEKMARFYVITFSPEIRA